MATYSSRRRFLQSGVFTFAVCGGRVGFAMPDDHDLTSASRGSCRSTIFVFLRGGLSHLDSFDPKPDGPAEIRGDFKAIPTRISDAYFSEHLPELAGIADRLTVVRSVAHTVLDHSLATHYLLTGSPSIASGSPGVGALLSSRFGWSIPPYHVAIPSIEKSAGSLGPNHEARNLLGDVGRMIQGSMPMVEGEGRAVWNRRRQLMEDLARAYEKRSLISQAPAVRKPSMVGARLQAAELLESTQMRKLLDLETIKQSEKNLYGIGSIAKYLILARRMAEAGSRFVVVRCSGFDTHLNNFESLKRRLPPVDRAIAGLIRDLDETGLKEHVNVFVTTEFGRSPEINADAGRGHWPKAGTIVCAGAGLKKGITVGSTDSSGAEPTSSPVGLDDLAATLLKLHGLDASSIPQPATQGRILPGSRIIEEVLDA